ncbi:(Fe-S)-binding protein [Microlunatus panaciterrae]|uniref:L-lactate dehydrogenase complex protein LldE n=1 Tax=Microlunatus panaciterrae TaxID=400768 RepID=A0ABS2RHU6_9ACTN|nr:L-lactate dehydrogenase complex protein LldE [Microlunatus panaciterrae]
MRVSLFITCLADTLFPDVGKATITVLERLGCDVDFPVAQTCCGQMHLNTGYPELAGGLVRSFAETFAGSEAVVLPSGSCAAMLRHHADRVAEGIELPPVYELSEFLIDVLGVTDVGARFPHTVTYHPTCHSLRLLGVGERPYRLLREVEGLELRELPGADECCGFGGTFAVKNAETSSAMGQDKVAAAVGTGAEILCASDSSCLMHLAGVAGREHAPLRTMHLAEILASTG